LFRTGRRRGVGTGRSGSGWDIVCAGQRLFGCGGIGCSGCGRGCIRAGAQGISAVLSLGSGSVHLPGGIGLGRGVRLGWTRRQSGQVRRCGVRILRRLLLAVRRELRIRRRCVVIATNEAGGIEIRQRLAAGGSNRKRERQRRHHNRTREYLAHNCKCPSHGNPKARALTVARSPSQPFFL
jgi:hypothetical protein